MQDEEDGVKPWVLSDVALFPISLSLSLISWLCSFPQDEIQTDDGHQKIGCPDVSVETPEYKSLEQP